MACLLTTGRSEACKDITAGIEFAYAIDWAEDAFTVSAANEATAIDAAVTVAYQYDLNSDNNNLVENMTSSRENGTRANNQTLTLSLKKQTSASAAELNTLVAARPIWVVKLNTGEYKVVGLRFGTTTTVNAESGGAIDSFNGYNLTITGKELQLAPTLDSATETAFLALVSGTQIDP